MTVRNRAFLLVGILGIVSSATVGCELIANFDRSKIDGGLPVEDAQALDASIDAPVSDDSGLDSTIPTDAAPDVAQEDAANDSNIPDAGPDSADAGCTGSAGCAVGQACDIALHQCTATCNASQPCNGTCCGSNGTCAAPETATACGLAGATCTSCTAGDAGAACVPGASGGQCGCDGPTDCPTGQACDTTTHQCTNQCSTSQLCNEGCCGSSGTCVVGTAAAACGASGAACLDCSTDSLGNACLAVTGGGSCGCSGPADCATGDAGGGACNTTTHQCTVSCSASQACSGSCCNGGTCGGGTTTACGPVGGTCTDCTASANGHECIGTACGCNDASDCPVGNSCNQGTHLCTNACTTTQLCNGTCCDPTSSKCAVSDTAAATCGDPGAMCASCSGTSGAQCVTPTDGGLGGACGCKATTDCPTGYACNTATNQCTTTCSGTQACNGTCCDPTSSQCAAADTAAATCGAAGGTCKDCPAGTLGDRCISSACGCTSASDCPVNMACGANGQCTTACSATSACNGGCCTSAGMCTTGTDVGACGSTGGACATCASNSVGTSCLAVTGGGTCGCTDSTMCISGYACDTTLDAGAKDTCTTTCSADDPCNGSCCNGGTCANDTLPASCGSAGGTCMDCTSNTAGHMCVAGACGCNSATDCPTNTACDTGTHTCTSSCSATQLCNGGCCNAGSCVTGTSDPTQCGKNGDTCNVCTGLTTGTACVSGVCGCSVASTDCPCSSGVGEACACTSNQCVDTTIGSFAATITGGNASTTSLSWTTNGTTCTIFDGTTTTSVSCTGSPQSVSPVGTTTYTFTAMGGGGSATATVTVSCHAVSNPAELSSACPTGATQFCETVPISATTSSQAQDACNVCNGAGLCTLDSGDTALGNANAWIPPVLTGGAVYYVFSNGSTASSLCTNSYEPAAGDIVSAGTCPEGHWDN